MTSPVGTSSPLVLMLLAKAFQRDIRPRLEATTLSGAGYSVFVFAWDRSSEFPSVEKVDGAVVRSFAHLRVVAQSRLGLALGAIIFQVLVVLEVLRFIAHLKQRPIIHAHDFNTLLPGCFLKILGLCAALVYDCHELSFGAYSELFSPLMGSIVRVIEERCVRFADAIITVSDPIERYLRRFNRTIELVYNYPRNRDMPRVSRAEARRQLGLPLGAFIVSHVGEIRYDSTLDLLLKVAVLAKDNENIRFLVVGGGPSAPAFRELAGKTQNARLTVLPYVPRKTALLYTLASNLTWAIYQNLPFSLNPRLTLPWKLFDSLACGVPVIVETGTFRAKLVEKLRCGVVLGSNDPWYISQVIVSLANDETGYGAMSIAAKDASTGQQFNWENTSHKLCETYERLRQPAKIQRLE